MQKHKGKLVETCEICDAVVITEEWKNGGIAHEVKVVFSYYGDGFPNSVTHWICPHCGAHNAYDKESVDDES